MKNGSCKYNRCYDFVWKKPGNDNLEQQAQALFKSWFVDFEPFKDGKFVESEMGMIPEGWRVGEFSQLTKRMFSGGTPKSMNSEYYQGDNQWYTTKELKDCFLFESEKNISNEAIENSSAKIFPSGSILMAIYASPTVGRLGILTKDATFNQAAVGIVPKDNIGVPYIYSLLFNERYNLNNLSSGAAQQNLNVQIVKSYKVILPNEYSLELYNRIANSIFKDIKNNQKEILSLSALRDTILPKLMSGELKINEMNS